MKDLPCYSNHSLAIIDQVVTSILDDTYDIKEVIQLLNTSYACFVDHLEDSLRYTETIELFIDAVDDLVDGYDLDNIIWDERSTNDLITIIQVHHPSYQLDKARYAHQESDNSRSLDKYVRELCRHHKRLLFVRVDLKYGKLSNNDIDIREFDFHIRKLRERMSNKKSVFKGLQGYAWALEQGYECGGLHCHLLLMYDGSKRQKDWGLANQVGELWKGITQGRGTYFNCNATKRLKEFDALDQRGIGMIYGDDEILVDNAVNTALYLTRTNKYDQRLKVSIPRMRTFGHGTYRNTKRRGLPPRSK